MLLPAEQMLISADDHLDIHAMPPDVWSSALPMEWRERGPHVEETPEGSYWFCNGQRVSPSGRKEKGLLSAHDHGFRPGQPKTRLVTDDAPSGPGTIRARRNVTRRRSQRTPMLAAAGARSATVGIGSMSGTIGGATETGAGSTVPGGRSPWRRMRARTVLRVIPSRAAVRVMFQPVKYFRQTEGHFCTSPKAPPVVGNREFAYGDSQGRLR